MADSVYWNYPYDQYVFTSSAMKQKAQPNCSGKSCTKSASSYCTGIWAANCSTSSPTVVDASVPYGTCGGSSCGSA
jgi:hypothetical protein